MHAVNNSAMLLSVVLSQHVMMMVLVSAIAQWVLGFLWYGVVFKKSWKALVGFAEGEKPKNAALAMVSSFIACLLLSYVLVHIVGWTAAATFPAGAKIGIICWLGFMAPPLFTQHIYENRRVNLFAINAAYWLLVMALGGGLLACFRG